ncbi:transcription termination factor Rho [Pimelobacter simplex]|uniref:transcription termination factor Rho n=1 Tax=Nocardioides simplex TaxID=2045 RepID=UPI0021504B8D|nr:transcription termination factor Rho [Pimelobacter simplex]UUW87424.1 transcription termination factor Rho [Pimelobacter simplex]UUW96929.1 transcription termination factor Rho [Pimelobacter simplex]
MTETPDSTPSAPAAAEKAPRKRSGGLNSMLLADLKAMANGMGIAGAGSMKKAALVDAIKAAQASGGSGGSGPARPAERAPQQPAAPEQPAAAEKPAPAEKPAAEKSAADKPAPERSAPEKQADQQSGGKGKGGNGGGKQQKQKQGGQQNQQQGKQQQPAAAKQQQQQQPAKQPPPAAPADAPHDAPNDADLDDDGDGTEGGSRRNRRRRGRDRDRTTRAGREPDTEVREDDVLVPAAGILDVLDNYAFVRTSGYLPGTDDVYLSLSMVRKYGLRRGDAITGQVRQPRDGERREKFNPMVRIDTVNGVDPEQVKNRVEFTELTPVSPTERLRLETTSENLAGRLIDLAAPVGKGQRGLIVSPARAGKTTLLQQIAAAITTNNPECHLMVVLVDERPEEVTDFERSIKGEVIASTFDRPAADHTILAELAIERAKRLVELGHDVVVLLDGLTRLGRAYNLAAPASGRILSGGVDASALFPPKRFFGAARNIENGGSLTVLATAVVDSGSRVDEVIFEELRGTENLELRLRSDLADKREFPAIDVVASGTRREELLLGKEELEIVWKLRRELADGDRVEGHGTLLQRLRNSKSNYEFLLRVQRD